MFVLSSCLFLVACGNASPETDISMEDATPEETVELSVPKTASVSSVKEFDPADIVAYKDECTKAITPSATTVRFADEANGFSIDLPHNESWGSAPYMNDENGMHFGPPVAYTSADGGCSNEAAFTLKVLPKRTADETHGAIIADYESHAMPTPTEGWGVDIIMVDRRAAVRWGIGEWACPMPTLEIPGTKVNLQLTVSCRYPKTPMQAQDDLEEIMRGIAFTQ